MDALRLQAAMGHHRNARRNQARDHFGLGDAAFQFHRLAAGLLEDPAGTFDRLVDAEVKAGKRHVHHHQGMAHRPAHHLGMVDHLVQRDRQGGGMALHDHRQAVAHQDAFDARGIDQLGRGIVVGGQHGDLLPGRFHGRELGNGDRGNVRCHGMAKGVKIGHGPT